MQGHEIREAFLEFFRDRGHQVQPSAPLAIEDPDLLFTIAGMVPLKPFFMGTRRPPGPRLVSCQRCFRTNDLERVGYTAHHHTFFEMLGNFSFGDYFKDEACAWGLEFVQRLLGLSLDRLAFTIFEEDEETYAIWKKLGVPPDRIFRNGMEDNFWSAAPVGPCGPDSEIFFDRGANRSCGRPDCRPGCECDRWVEIWNLVFMQFNRDTEGTLTALPAKNVDTGMGLERVTSVLQDVPDDFQTDLFQPIVDWLNALSCVPGYRRARRVIADHLRGLVFLLAEGIVPSNTGRGYVVRRVLRRAVRYGMTLGLQEPFLYRGVPVVAEAMGVGYPELNQPETLERVSDLIRDEEASFFRTLSRGLHLLESTVEETKGRGEAIIAAADVFRLYDTYGFPFDLTREISQEKGLAVNLEEAETYLAEQRARSRHNARRSQAAESGDVRAALEEAVRHGATSEFVGYEATEAASTVVALIIEGQLVDRLDRGEAGLAVLSATPFYPEGGGQVADRGSLVMPGGEATVQDVQRSHAGLITHRIEIRRGSLRCGEKVTARVDVGYRRAVSRSHTATHLLHAVLRNLIGNEVAQSGSLVEADRLRFDFTLRRPLSGAELEQVEERLNRAIDDDLPVQVRETSLAQAESEGAMALFEDKYGDTVRMVSIDPVSREVCGGCHARRTGELRPAVIVSHSGVAAGIRRIEMQVGSLAAEWLRTRGRLARLAANHVTGKRTGDDAWKAQRNELIRRLRELSRTETAEERLLAQLEQLSQQLTMARTELDQCQKELVQGDGSSQSARVTRVGEIVVKTQSWPGVNPDILRQNADRMRGDTEQVVIVLASVNPQKARLVVLSTVPEVPADKVVRRVAAQCGGSGGGRIDFAQGGTSEPDRVDGALQQAPQIVASLLASDNPEGELTEGLEPPTW